MEPVTYVMYFILINKSNTLVNETWTKISKYKYQCRNCMWTM